MTLRKSAAGGAIGFGEIKYHLAVNSTEMRRLYDLAAKLNLPVLIHFVDVPQYEGEGTFTSPFSGLPAMLKAHPKTTFSGHADGLWANISADFANAEVSQADLGERHQAIENQNLNLFHFHCNLSTGLMHPKG